MPSFTTPLHEFNACHDPATGEFCATATAAGQHGSFTRKGYTATVSGDPADPATWFAGVNRALAAGGHGAGRHHRGSGWSDWGDLVYEPPQKGYVVDSRPVGHDAQHSPLYRWYVDHAGAGRKAALPQYAEALQAAGFETRIDKIHELMKKPVVWVTGRRG